MPLNNAITIDYPAGPEWLFSLDPTAAPADFRPDRQFLANYDGSPFVDGQIYPVRAYDPTTDTMQSWPCMFVAELGDAILLHPAMIPTFDQVLGRGFTTRKVPHVGGLSGDWDLVTSAAEQLVIKVVNGKKRLAVMAISGAAPLILSQPPDQIGTVGGAFSYVVPTGTVTATDTPTVRWQANGPLPAGLSFDGPTRTIAGKPTTAGTYRISLLATTSGGRELVVEIVLVVKPTAQNFNINRIFRATNPGGSLSVYVDGDAGEGGIMESVLESVEAGVYPAQTREGDTNGGKGHEKPSLFGGTVKYGMLWANVNGVNSIPPTGVPLRLTTRKRGSDLVRVNLFTLEAGGSEAQVYPESTTPVNHPPTATDKLPTEITIEQGGYRDVDLTKLFTDIDGDALTLTVITSPTAAAYTRTGNIVRITGAGTFQVSASDGISQNGAQTIECVVKVSPISGGRATLVRVDYKNEKIDNFQLGGGGTMQALKNYWRFKISNLPNNATLVLERTRAGMPALTVNLTASAGDWYTHVASDVIQFGTGNEQYYTWKLLINGENYYQITGVDRVLVPDWNTLLDDTPPPPSGGAITLDAIANQQMTYPSPSGVYIPNPARLALTYTEQGDIITITGDNATEGLEPGKAFYYFMDKVPVDSIVGKTFVKGQPTQIMKSKGLSGLPYWRRCFVSNKPQDWDPYPFCPVDWVAFQQFYFADAEN